MGYNCPRGPEALIGLRQLHADWTPADNDHRLGQYFVIEDVFVSDIGHVMQTRDCRNERLGAGCQEKLFRAHDAITYFDRCGIDELGVSKDYINSFALKLLWS